MSVKEAIKTKKFWASIAAMLAILVVLYFGTQIFLKFLTHHGESVIVPNVEGLTIAEAEEKFDEMGIEIQIDSVNFNDKYKPYQVYRQEIPKGSKVKPGRTILVKANPSGPRPVKLPSILEQSYRLAEQQLGLSHIKIGKITYEPSIAKDAVLKVIYRGKLIKPGTLIPRNATVDLVLGQGYNQSVSLPSLYGMTVEEAEKALILAHFQMGMAIEKNVTDRPTARVYDQNPSAGTVVEQGQRVNIYITNDPIPDEDPSLSTRPKNDSMSLDN